MAMLDDRGSGIPGLARHHVAARQATLASADDAMSASPRARVGV